MKLLLLFLSISLLYSLGSESKFKITKEDEYIVSIPIPRGSQDLDTLVKLGLNLDHPRGDKSYVQAYVDSEELEKLTNNGFSYIPVELPTRESRAKAWKEEHSKVTRDTLWNWDVHHNYDSMVQILQEVARRYPNITKLFSIGQTKQGRQLWVMEISDNPGVNEPGEPEFKYIANMHGDEVVGREIVLRLIVEMCQTYYLPSDNPSEKLWSRDNIRRLIHETDIFLMPSMNPDGYERNSRYNSNYQDLNRSFPDRVTGPIKQAEKEVQAVMDWTLSKSFVLSANYHGGEVVANYPWDGNFERRSGQYAAAPDDALFKALALEYAKSHTSMSKNPYFTNGITNGAQWYVLYGGMQDWNYWAKGCFEITLEVSMTKTPRGSSLPDYWEENRVATIAFMQWVHTGIKGFVRTVDGKPLAANITIDGIDHTVQTDPQNGDYYRLLVPRSTPYTLIVSAKGSLQSYQFTLTAAERLKIRDFTF